MSKFTHKGWFGLCPVYIAGIDSDTVELMPRYDWLEWLLSLSEILQGAAISILSSISEDYDPQWAIRVTGELNTPIEKS